MSTQFRESLLHISNRPVISVASGDASTSRRTIHMHLDRAPARLTPPTPIRVIQTVKPKRIMYRKIARRDSRLLSLPRLRIEPQTDTAFDNARGKNNLSTSSPKLAPKIFFALLGSVPRMTSPTKADSTPSAVSHSTSHFSSRLPTRFTRDPSLICLRIAVPSLQAVHRGSSRHLQGDKKTSTHRGASTCKNAKGDKTRY